MATYAVERAYPMGWFLSWATCTETHPTARAGVGLRAEVYREEYREWVPLVAAGVPLPGTLMETEEQVISMYALAIHPPVGGAWCRGTPRTHEGCPGLGVPGTHEGCLCISYPVHTRGGAG
mmetsp:Transcript_3633/g.8652  ORF Transcript_3633/g.8652 Transcript_3633/m.8652 type:complete len:121 (-) Transcript_3633:55-417(-)